MTLKDPASDLAQMRKNIYQEARRATSNWFERQVQSPGTRMYVYFRPHEISFDIRPEKPGPNWRLARSRPVSVAATKDQVTSMICELSNELPILGSPDNL